MKQLNLKNVMPKRQFLGKFMFLFLALTLALSAFGALENPVLKLTIAKTDPVIITTGEFFDLYLKVDNIANADAKNVVVEFVNKDPFTIDGDNVEIIGLLSSQNDFVIKYRVKVDEDALGGVNTIKFRYSVDGVNYVETDFTVILEKNDADLVIGDIDSEPLDLTADLDDAKLIVNLQNIGDSKAKLVTAKLLLPEGIIPSNSFSDVDSLAGIDSDGSDDLTFFIDIDESLNEGNYAAKLELRFKEDNTDEYIVKTLDLYLPIKASPKFEVQEVVYSEDVMNSGDVVDMIVKIKNVGGEDAQSVSIRAFQSVGLPLDFDEKSSFIGTIKSGETGDASLKFTIDDDATAKNYLLDLEIRTVTSDEVKVFGKTVSFDIVEKVKGGNSFLLIAGIVLVLGVGGFFYFRKKH